MAPSNPQAPNNLSSPLLGYGLPSSEPQLYDLLMVLKSNILISLNCVKIGEIASYSATNKTASVNILGVRVLTDGTTVGYPQLSDVPVMTMQGGGSALQFPVSVGDQCLVVFSDRNLDNWYVTGTAQPPANSRLHDLSDGIAIVGLNSKSDPTLPAASSTETRLISTDDFGTITAKVGLENGKVTVQNQTQSLATALGNLLTALEALTVTVSGATGTVSPTTVTALQAVGTELQALLY